VKAVAWLIQVGRLFDAAGAQAGRNGDHTAPNAYSRLHYSTMCLRRILQRIESTAPQGADLTSWRH
jgi:hypothetical protein